jgi:deoxyribonuclease V
MGIIMRYWWTHVKEMLNECSRVVNKHLNRYNRIVKARELHGWQVSGGEAREIQARLREAVIRDSDAREPRFVAGVDISVTRDGFARAAVVVLRFPDMMPLETKVAEGRLGFPYVPGLLSFREAPLILAACEQLNLTPDLLIVDGQGIAHPRRFGLASHLGVLLDIPSIGCAKSLLCGEYVVPAAERGSLCHLTDKGEVIGAVLRSKTAARPLFVSIGHRIDLITSVNRVIECCGRYRLPEPTRLAHLAAAGSLAEPVGA